MTALRNPTVVLAIAALAIGTLHANQSPFPPEVDALYPESFLPELRALLDALEGSTPALIEQQRIDEAEFDVIIARATRLPRIYAEIQLNITAEDREDFEDIIWRQRPVNRLSMAQPIFHWGALKAGQRAAEIQVGNTELAYQRSIKSLRHRVRQLYFQLVEREYGLLLAQRRLESAQRSLSTADIQFDLGNASRNQLLRTEYHVRNMEGNVFNSLQLLQSVRFQIFEQTGIRVGPMSDIEQRIQDFFAVRLAEVGEIDEPPGITDESALILENQVAQLDHRYVQERARDRPRLDVVASVFQDEIGRTQQDSITRTNLFVGFRVVWDIFRGGDGKARRQKVLAQKQRLLQGLEMSTQKLAEEYDYIQERIVQTMELLEARQTQIAAMEEIYDQRQVEIDQGRALEDDLFDDRINLDQSRLTFVRLLTDLLLLQAQFADLVTTSLENARSSTFLD